jgi:predicted MPP superfamily phosphohydrolase
MTAMTRREAISRLLGLGVVGAFDSDLLAKIPGASGSADFHFVVLNDLHYRDARCGEWLGRVAADIRALRPAPAFCVLDGDLAESGTRAQLGAVREIFTPLPMPLRVVIGNHDCAEDGNRSEFEALFGKAPNFGFEHKEWKFLVLDTTQGPDVYRTRIAASTLDWLDKKLSTLNRNRPVLVLTHFPLGRNWLRPLNAGLVLERFKKHSLRGVLSGHWHGITEREQGDVMLSTSRCCSWWRDNHDGSDLKGYTLCQVRDGTLTHRFVPVAV